MIDAPRTDLHIGDICTAYTKGYWRIVNITRRFITPEYFKYSSYVEIEPGVYQYKYEPRNIIRIGQEYSQLVTLERVATQTMKPAHSTKQEHCDASYCTVITHAVLDAMQQEILQNIDAMRALLIEG